MPAFVLASLVSDEDDPDRFIWLEFWDFATPPPTGKRTEDCLGNTVRRSSDIVGELLTHLCVGNPAATLWDWSEGRK